MANQNTNQQNPQIEYQEKAFSSFVNRLNDILGLVRPDGLNEDQSFYWDILFDHLKLGFLTGSIAKDDIEDFLKDFYKTPDNEKMYYLNELERQVYEKYTENTYYDIKYFENLIDKDLEVLQNNLTEEQFEQFLQYLIHGEDTDNYREQADELAEQKLANALERRGGFNRPLDPYQITNLAETGKKDFIPQDEPYNPSNIRTPSYDRPSKQDYRKPPVRINPNNQRPAPGRGSISSSQNPQYENQNNFQPNSSAPQIQQQPKKQPNQNNRFVQNEPKGLDDLLNNK
jgi:hypothetical protein